MSNTGLTLCAFCSPAMTMFTNIHVLICFVFSYHLYHLLILQTIILCWPKGRTARLYNSTNKQMGWQFMLLLLLLLFIDTHDIHYYCNIHTTVYNRHRIIDLVINTLVYIQA